MHAIIDAACTSKHTLSSLALGDSEARYLRLFVQPRMEF